MECRRRRRRAAPRRGYRPERRERPASPRVIAIAVKEEVSASGGGMRGDARRRRREFAAGMPSQDPAWRKRQPCIGHCRHPPITAPRDSRSPKCWQRHRAPSRVARRRRPHAWPRYPLMTIRTRSFAIIRSGTDGLRSHGRAVCSAQGGCRAARLLDRSRWQRPVREALCLGVACTGSNRRRRVESRRASPTAGATWCDLTQRLPCALR